MSEDEILNEMTFRIIAQTCSRLGYTNEQAERLIKGEDHYKVMEFVKEAIRVSGQFISVKQWKEKLEAKRQQLISLIKSDSELEQTMRKIGREPYEIGYSDAMGKARISELHLVEQFLSQLPKSQPENIDVNTDIHYVVKRDDTIIVCHCGYVGASDDMFSRHYQKSQSEKIET
ncbi:MAG: hypothetical protein M1587_05050 [Thaumarchaeota archaeon]|nr:hypothetical protein [Nitrososphaerota archaeon]